MSGHAETILMAIEGCPGVGVEIDGSHSSAGVRVGDRLIARTGLEVATFWSRRRPISFRRFNGPFLQPAWSPAGCSLTSMLPAMMRRRWRRFGVGRMWRGWLGNFAYSRREAPTLGQANPAGQFQASEARVCQ
jgi:hypothetical protein